MSNISNRSSYALPTTATCFLSWIRRDPQQPTQARHASVGTDLLDHPEAAEYCTTTTRLMVSVMEMSQDLNEQHSTSAPNMNIALHSQLLSSVAEFPL
jgi:hypothetical protein